MDEIPLPFEFLEGQTCADKGSTTFQVKSSRSGWDKRQATIFFCVFADGAMRVQPLIIFKGSDNLNVIYRKTNHHKDSSRHYGAINVLLSRSEDSLRDLARPIYCATTLPDSIT